jgi:NAD(P)-dependent dehydrogenase (short-subunit alcohol dehydrogenase family)
VKAATFDLSGTVVMITGAGGGIGSETARAVASSGAAVVLGDLSEDNVRATEAGIRAAGGSVAAMRVDVSDPAATVALAKFAVATFGRLDGALCVAGKLSRETILTCTPEEWKAVMDVNLFGTFATIQAAAREMIACGNGGSIVAYSSAIVLHSPPTGTAYSSSKLGMLALMKSAAGELGPHGVRVNAIAPGIIRSPMSRPTSWPKVAESAPLRRVGDPEDLVGPALFLLSPDSSYVTGHTMYVNGGAYMA